MADWFRRGRNLRRLRESLHWAQSGLCPICRKPMMDPMMARMARPTSPGYPTIDHVLPLDRDGREAACNTLLTHQKCNNERGNDMPSRRLLRVAYWVHKARQMRHRLQHGGANG